MRNLQNPIIAEAYKILYKMKFDKNLTAGTSRAICVRLQAILDEKEKSYAHWQEMIKPKMNATRVKMVEREFRKTIQAYKITIHSLTPFYERISDVPTFVVRKERKDAH